MRRCSGSRVLVPVEVDGDSSAARGAASGGAASGDAELGDVKPGGVEPGGAEPEGVEPGGAESEGAECGGADPRGTASSGGPAGASPRLSPQPEPLSPQQLSEWFAQRTCRWSGAAGAGDYGARDTGAGGVGATRLGGSGVTAGARGTRGTAATCPGGAHTRGTGATGTSSAGGAGAGGAGAVDPGGGGGGAGGAMSSGTGAGGTVRPQPYFVPLLQQVLGLPSSHVLTPPLLSESRPASPARTVCTGHRVPRPRPPPFPGTHAMALRPSSVPLRVPLPPPPVSSLPIVLNPESDLAFAASPTVSRLLATVVTDPSFESTSASSLVTELVDFAAVCHLDYATALVVEPESARSQTVGAECAPCTDVLEDRQEEFECLAAAVPHFTSMLLAPEGDPDAPDIPTPCSYAEVITGPYSSKWHIAMDAEMASWKSTGTYVNAVPPSGANIVDACTRRSGCAAHVASLGRVLQIPSGASGGKSTVCRVHWEWHDTLRTTLAALGFTPLTANPSLFLRTNTRLPPFYVLVYITRDRARRTITLTQSHMMHQFFQRFGFQFSSPLPTPLSTNHSLSAPPSDESVEPSGLYPELVGCLITSGMGLVLGGRGPVVLTGHVDTSWVDDSVTQRSSQGYTFSLGSGSVSWRSTRSSSVLSSSCEAEIYAGVMAAQELRWLTYLLTDLGERPCLPPVLYVDNKAMIALCQEHKLEHRLKHTAKRYFLARELQQRGHLRLAYVAVRIPVTRPLGEKGLLSSGLVRP
ncbi:unnamed protein product [Closterium sp. NIES-53]